jgi:trans-aconitate methyltransferase
VCFRAGGCWAQRLALLGWIVGRVRISVVPTSQPQDVGHLWCLFVKGVWRVGLTEKNGSEKSGVVQGWSAADYAREGRFVADMAGAVVELLAAKPGERVLDLGCGDGALTERLAAMGVDVLGVDSAPDMVRAAQARGVQAREVSAERLPFTGEFDAVFSNAALHWVRDQDAMLAGVARALKPGGRFVAEMGGQGNIAAMRVALRAALTLAGRAELIEHEGVENYFPSPEEYRARLERHGFTVETIGLFPRPTPLAKGGVKGWFRTFRTGVLSALSAEEQGTVLETTERFLLPVLAETREDGSVAWTADYVRLRFRATCDA